MCTLYEQLKPVWHQLKKEVQMGYSLVGFINTAPVNSSLYTHLDKCQGMFGL
jgi:hypothetical protein